MLKIAIMALQGALALASLSLVVSAVAAFTGSTPEQSGPQLAAAIEPSAESGMPRYQIIPARNLFRAGSDAADAPDAPPADLVESKLAIQVQGTVVTRDRDARGRNLSQATIRDTDGTFKVVTQGSLVAQERARIEAIQDRRIVIRVGERLEAITFADSQSATPSVRSGPDDATLRQAMRQATQPSGLADMSQKLGRMISVTQSVNASGEFDGVRITSVAPGSEVDKLGLKAGDRIVSINGNALTANGLPPELLQSLFQKDPTVTVQGENGEPREITVPRAVLLKMR